MSRPYLVLKAGNQFFRVPAVEDRCDRKRKTRLEQAFYDRETTISQNRTDGLKMQLLSMFQVAAQMGQKAKEDQINFGCFFKS